MQQWLEPFKNFLILAKISVEVDDAEQSFAQLKISEKSLEMVDGNG